MQLSKFSIYYNHALLISSALIMMALVLFLMGRTPICECGYVKLWHGVVISSENSQHIFDWYTFTHVVHGIIFYGILTILNKQMSVGKKLLLAVGIECAWEILENTDMIIDRYRATTISLDYYGDSIVNSVSDVVAMMAGFWFAAKNRVWQSIGFAVLLEIVLAFTIRDNLTINIIMLIFPLDVIKNWQSLL